MTFLYEILGQLLYFIYSIIDNYGLAIIIFTVVVKLILFPLTKKQTDSMKKMQEIQPQMQELQQKHKGNKEKLNQEMMKLYQEYNYNPAGGCLPLVVQMPILIGLFRVLQQPQTYVFPSGTYETVAQNFLWLPDLGSPDPYYLLPILVVASQYFATKLMSAKSASNGPQQQTQKTMNAVMPLMIGFISINFPSGLALYFVISNVLQLLQQYISLRGVSRNNKEVSR